MTLNGRFSRQQKTSSVCHKTVFAQVTKWSMLYKRIIKVESAPHQSKKHPRKNFFNQLCAIASQILRFTIFVNEHYTATLQTMNRLTFICIASIFPAANSWILPGIAAEGVRRCRNLQNNMLPETATSIFAGAAAGAVGVGVAFPLDTVKTKQQVEQETSSRIEYSISPSGDISIVAAPQLNSLSTTVNDIWKSKGLGGFYGGVQTSMLGQAVIKATAFSVNTAALQANYDLETAAAIAGLVTAFIAVPVDRIKVLMQTDSFKTEHECLESVLDTEGVKGLLFTGLVPTLFREIPAYTLYFSLYGMLMSSAALGTATLGPMAPMVSGALAGALCVVPIHPVDVVKTIVQHSATDWKEVVSDIYEGQGLEGFWEGLIPRMGRAAINHSVTFAVYESLMYLR